MVERIFARLRGQTRRICAYPPGFTFRMTPCVWQFGCIHFTREPTRASMGSPCAPTRGGSTSCALMPSPVLLLVLPQSGAQRLWRRCPGAARRYRCQSGAARHPAALLRCWGRPLNHLNGGHEVTGLQGRMSVGHSKTPICGIGPVISTERAIMASSSRIRSTMRLNSSSEMHSFRAAQIVSVAYLAPVETQQVDY